MNNQSNKDQKNFGRQTDKVSQDQKRNDFQRDQRTTGGSQRNISPDAKRSSPVGSDLNE